MVSKTNDLCNVHARAFSACGCIRFNDPSLTKQAFKEDCDINEILRRAANGQPLSESMSTRVANYGDFTGVPDFHGAMNLVARANSMFMELPWDIREKFNNDPGNLINFLNDPKNREEAVKLGLVNPPASDPKVKVGTPVTEEAKPATAGAAGAPEAPKK